MIFKFKIFSILNENKSDIGLDIRKQIEKDASELDEQTIRELNSLIQRVERLCNFKINKLIIPPDIDREIFKKEIEEHERILNKYKDEDIEGFRNSMSRLLELLRLQRELCYRIDPIIYVVAHLDPRTKKTYLQARCNFVDRFDEIHKLTMHIGSIDKFKLGKDDPKAKEIGKQQIIKKIVQKYPYIDIE